MARRLSLVVIHSAVVDVVDASWRLWSNGARRSWCDDDCSHAWRVDDDFPHILVPCKGAKAVAMAANTANPHVSFNSKCWVLILSTKGFAVLLNGCFVGWNLELEDNHLFCFVFVSRLPSWSQWEICVKLLLHKYRRKAINKRNV